jgi:hypothetical protein
MLDLQPHMNDTLAEDLIEFNTNPMSCISKDALMVAYWDDVSANVIRIADELGVPPRYIIEEFCVDTDYPNYIPMTPGEAYD